jgi:hypothetical protein
VPDGCDVCPGYDDTQDADGDGTPDDCDGCPEDPFKVEPGICGCGVPDEGDDDGDGFLNCIDTCPGVDDAEFGPCDPDLIPTVSTWGVIVLGLLLLVFGKIFFGRRRVAA